MTKSNEQKNVDIFLNTVYERFDINLLLSCQNNMNSKRIARPIAKVATTAKLKAAKKVNSGKPKSY